MSVGEVCEQWMAVVAVVGGNCMGSCPRCCMPAAKLCCDFYLMYESSRDSSAGQEADGAG